MSRQDEYAIAKIRICDAVRCQMMQTRVTRSSTPNAASSRSQLPPLPQTFDGRMHGAYLRCPPRASTVLKMPFCGVPSAVAAPAPRIRRHKTVTFRNHYLQRAFDGCDTTTSTNDCPSQLGKSSGRKDRHRLPAKSLPEAISADDHKTLEETQ